MDLETQSKQDQQTPYPPTSYYVSELGRQLTALLIGAVFALGLGIVAISGIAYAARTFIWLRSGEWTFVAAAEPLAYLGFNEWLASPESWIGLHQLITALSLPALGLILGLLLIAVSIIAGLVFAYA